MNKISKEDSDWVVEKLKKWKIGDVFCLLKIFGAHLILAEKKKMRSVNNFTVT